MKKRTKILLIILSSIIVFRLLSSGISLAKYVGSSIWNYYLETKGFYFNSDVLNSDNVNNNWDGKSIHFDIKNSQSSLLASDYDINYKVTCNIKNNNNAKCFLNNTNTNLVTGVLSSYEECVDLSNKTDPSDMDYQTCINNGFEFRAKETKKDMYFDIIGNDGAQVNSAIVEVILESTYPYKKTIVSEFILTKGLDETSKTQLIYNEYDNYSRVIINNSFNENKCLKLSWDSNKFRINKENVSKYSVDNNGYINEIIFNVSSDSLVDYTFYRVDNEINYTEEDFNLIQSNEC